MLTPEVDPVNNRYRMIDKFEAIEVKISGLVQGVGFRPFIYRLANELQLAGNVWNQVDGVRVHLEGPGTSLAIFLQKLKSDCPPAADIQHVSTSVAEPGDFKDFTIIESAGGNDQVTRISPDLAVCEACLDDMRSDPRRIEYPFTNCTNCGPRFSIVKGLPYDRSLTTMSAFEMCDECAVEYRNVLDRRFHAQPVACSLCGPVYDIALREPAGDPDAGSITVQLAHIIDSGGIVALKGLGGYHLVCDATNEKVVARLRSNKRREGKPLAVMVRDSGIAAVYAHVTGGEKELLESMARPIVLLQRRNPPLLRPGPEQTTQEMATIAGNVTSELHTIGLILPYMPLHHMLFDELRTPAIVLTSGNLSSEPIERTNEGALLRLGPISDAVVSHNRDIHNRLDDSVAMVVNGRRRMLRRSRGYVPTPVSVPLNVDGIVAMGAEQKNTLCFGSGNEALLSQHIGDVDGPETVDFVNEVLDRFPALFRIQPRLIAVDRHPDYISGAIGRDLGLPVVEVGHHHAHIASCMAENGLTEGVIGVALDGTGYGNDGTVWGGEILIADLVDADRFAHFAPVRLPGGDLASEHPWRSALAYLVHSFGAAGIPDAVRGALRIFQDSHVSESERTAVFHAIDARINAPQSSSAGRLFDAVAALCGLCLHSEFDAEAPIRLTDCVQPGVREQYPFALSAPAGSVSRELQFAETVRRIAGDVATGVPVGLISTMFHNTICHAVVEAVSAARDRSGLNRAVLSGGVFQNWYILEKSEAMLQDAGFEVFSHGSVPSNDGGISLGQVMIAAARSAR